MAIKTAVIGMGGIGNTHAKVYFENVNTNLIAVCDIQKEKADKALKENGTIG